MASSKRRLPSSALALILGAGLMAYGGWGLVLRYRATHNPHPVIPQAVVTQSADARDETDLSGVCSGYAVPGSQPRMLAIDAIGVSGCIQRVGLDQLGAMVAPTNIHLAGWYVNSVAPGERGVSVLDGHVSGSYSKDAVFARLGSLKQGDSVRVQRGDGSWQEFFVEDVRSYPADQAMAKVLEPLASDVRQLTLITCSGLYDANERRYDDRVVVRATAKQ